jgi:ATP-binding cassette subfamily C (CFTR/MRP) protein 4
MDSDKVLVMESGSMVEFDHPHVLLQNSMSKFSKMVAESGKSMAEQLKKVARSSYQKKHTVPE